MRRRHHDLQAWQAAIAFVKTVYTLTASFPKTEQFGLAAQMRRAAISVPCNIAEGAARSSKKEFAHFLVVARGSLSELDTQLIIANDLGFWETTKTVQADIDRLFALLTGLLRSIRSRDPSQ